MLNFINIKNFQSHKNSTLKFGPRINVIVGSSDSGKSAIFRAINWCIKNKPLGLSYVSYWNRDKKGSPVKNTEVTIQKDDKEISRIRTNDFNGYEIYEGEDSFEGIDAPNRVFEAIGNDSVDDIDKIFNLTDVNIQKQHDAPFLLSESSSEVARFLNKTIRLDVIDKVLKNAELQRKRTKTKINELKENHETITTKISEYDFIGDVNILLNNIERRKERLEKKKVKIDQIISLITVYKDSVSKLKQYKNIDVSIELSKNISILITKLQNNKKKLADITYFKTQIKNISETINIKIDYAKSMSLIKKIEAIDKQIKTKAKDISNIEKILIETESYNEKLNTETLNIKMIMSQLPEVCPTCNRPF